MSNQGRATAPQIQHTMKHYIIKTWELGEEKPVFAAAFTDEQEAEEEFISRANRILYDGAAIDHIIHRWNYHFKRQDGTKFKLYMYEDSNI